jgi:2,5-furandicarboxylate decarboxylase 1
MSRATNPPLHDLGLIIETLDKAGQLIRVRSEVDPVHQLASVASHFEGRAQAVLFEKVRGHEHPVFTGLYWSRELLAELIGAQEKKLASHISGKVQQWQADPHHKAVEPQVVETGPVRQYSQPVVDLFKLPIPTHAERDGGPYIDAGVVVVSDPETGVRNASIQRFMLVDRDRLHVNIDAGRHLQMALDHAEKRGETLKFSLNIGVGPGVHFAAVTPAEAAPPDSDELGIASVFHGDPMELVRGDLPEVELIAHAMYSLECEIVPGEVADEGPFAEVTGYYAKVAPRPVVHVRAVHHRANPIFQTIICGKEVWNSAGVLGEASVLASVSKQVPGITDVYFPHGGCGFYHAVVQISQKRAGFAQLAVLSAFAAFPPLKMVTVVDEDVDIRNASDVEWAMTTRLDPTTGVITVPAVFGHGLNPTFPNYFGAKIGFNATHPFPKTYSYERVRVMAVNIDGLDIEIPEPVPSTQSLVDKWTAAERAERDGQVQQRKSSGAIM